VRQWLSYGSQDAKSRDVVVNAAATGDTFEQLVNTYLDHRSKRLSARLGAGVRSSLSRFGALINKHRRAESTQMSPTFGLSGSGSGPEQLSASASGGIASSLMSSLSRGRSGGLSSSFAERPEALRMRQMVASFAAAAENIRRTLNDNSSSSGRVHMPHMVDFLRG
jgi:hypothetical protein